MPVLRSNSGGKYSIVIDNPLRTKRTVAVPTIDGDSVIQTMGSIEIKTLRFHWITTDELQDEINHLEEEASDGWVIVGEVSRDAIHEALDLYNARVVMRRYIIS